MSSTLRRFAGRASSPPTSLSVCSRLRPFTHFSCLSAQPTPTRSDAAAVEETRALGTATSTIAQLQAIRPTRPIQRVAPPSGQPAVASSAHAIAKGPAAPVTDMEVDSPSEDDLIDVDFQSSAKNSPIAHPSPSPKPSAVRTKRPAPAGDEDGHPERRRRIDEPSESTDALDTSHLTSFEDCPKAGLWDGAVPSRAAPPLRAHGLRLAAVPRPFLSPVLSSHTSELVASWNTHSSSMDTSSVEFRTNLLALPRTRNSPSRLLQDPARE